MTRAASSRRSRSPRLAVVMLSAIGMVVGCSDMGRPAPMTIANMASDAVDIAITGPEALSSYSELPMHLEAGAALMLSGPFEVARGDCLRGGLVATRDGRVVATIDQPCPGSRWEISDAMIAASSTNPTSISSEGALATKSAVPTDQLACDAVDLEGQIVRWEAVDGGRTAMVELRSTAAGDCALPSDPKPALLDADGVPLIVGATERWHQAISPAEVLHSTVEVRNYCGADGRDPVMIFVEATFDDGTDSMSFLPATDGGSGVPPCNDVNGPTDEITMGPWEAGPAPAG